MSNEQLAHIVYAFVVLRFVHAFFFVMALQPFRTLTWLVGAGAMVTQAVVALDLATAADPLAAAFIITAAVLQLKLILIHVWTVRARCQHDDEAQPEDKTNRGFRMISKVVGAVLAHGPMSKPPELVERLAKNAAENEQFFMLVTLALVHAPAGARHCGWPNEALVKIVYAFVALRFVHAFFFLMAFQPFRTITWLVSAGAMITQAVVALDFKEGIAAFFGIHVFPAGLCAAIVFQMLYVVGSRHFEGSNSEVEPLAQTLLSHGAQSAPVKV
jgi:multisubunit Na+/H+ antiporter MnhC subunit